MPSYENQESWILDTGRVTGGPTYRLDLSQVVPSPIHTPVVPGEHVSAPTNTTDFGGYLVPHVATFAYRYNQTQQAYWYLHDEALKYGQQTSLAMRRDPFIHELLRHRQLPVVSRPVKVESDDKNDKDKQKTIKEIQQVIDSIKRFQIMRLTLSEAIFYGKYGVQLRWGHVGTRNNRRYIPTGFLPVNGDKIRHRWSGTPGILVRDDDDMLSPQMREHVTSLDIGKVIWLETEELKERFIIHEFEPSDTDYMFEGDMAESVHGMGLRSRLFWAWNIRIELLGYYLDAIQRIGANGMLFAFYKTGNPNAKQATLEALYQLARDNISAFETDANQGNLKDIIQSIPPSNVGYENIFQLLQHLEDIMRRAVLGQNLSSESGATGLGSSVGDLQGEVRDAVILYDAIALGESLDDQLLRSILKHNFFMYKGTRYRGSELPFTVSLKIGVDEKSITEKIQIAQALTSMGVQLDADELREMTGFSAPKNKANAVPPPQPEAGPGGAGGDSGAQKALATLTRQMADQNGGGQPDEDSQAQAA